MSRNFLKKEGQVSGSASPHTEDHASDAAFPMKEGHASCAASPDAEADVYGVGERIFLFTVALLTFARVVQNSDLTAFAICRSGVYGLYALFLLAAAARIAILIRSGILTPVALSLFVISLTVTALNYRYMSDYRSVFLLPFLVLSASGVSFRDMVKMTFLGALVGLLLVLSLYFAGVVNGLTENALNRVTGGYTMRYSYGFTDFNAVGRFTLLIFASFCYLEKNSLKVRDFVFWLVIAGVLYFVVFTKTASAAIVFSLVLLLALPFCDRVSGGAAAEKPDVHIDAEGAAARRVPPAVPTASRRAVYILAAMSVLAVITGFLLPLLYDPANPFFAKLNSLLTNRLLYTKRFIDSFGIGLFGQDLGLSSVRNYYETGEAFRVLDNSYYRLLLNYGAAAFLFFAGMYIASAKKALRLCSAPLMFLIFISVLLGNLETWTYIDFAFLILPSVEAVTEPFEEAAPGSERRRRPRTGPAPHTPTRSPDKPS